MHNAVERNTFWSTERGITIPRVYVNGMANTGDEMIGTKYFHVPPGETKVQFYCSGFCNPAPVVTARIKEAFL